MDVTARGKVVKDPSGDLALQVSPNRAYQFAGNELSQGLESLAGSPTVVTLRGQLYKKPAGKKKPDNTHPLKLTVLEVQKKE
jgi:hypothetical protein